MGKVDRLHDRVEHFPALFWALGILLDNTSACRPGITRPPYIKHVLIWSWLVHFCNKDKLALPLFLSTYQ